MANVSERMEENNTSATGWTNATGDTDDRRDCPAREGLSAIDVKTAGRTLDLFEVFAQRCEALSISGLARLLAMPVSSTFNLIRSLENRGHLYSIGPARGRLYYPTRKLFRMSQSIAVSQPWLQELEPRLRAARDQSGETAILGTWARDQVVYLAVAEGSHVIRYTAVTGECKPFHSSAIGKALMSTRSPQERLATLERSPAYPITEHTIVNRAALIAEFDLSERRGYAETSGENVVDVMGIAIALNLQGACYAVALAGPIGRMRAKREAHLACLQEIFADLIASATTTKRPLPADIE